MCFNLKNYKNLNYDIFEHPRISLSFPAVQAIRYSVSDELSLNLDIISLALAG